MRQAQLHMAQLERLHTGKFRTAMRDYFGDRVDGLLDADIRPVVETAVRANADQIETIPPRYHEGLKADLLRLAGEGPFDGREVGRR